MTAGRDAVLDRDSSTPLYVQLADILRDRIDAGEWRPNSRIPSENELNHEYGLSRMTVRQVLTQLVNEGRLFRVQGKGTFVAPGKIATRSPAYTGIRQQLEEAGFETSTRLVETDVEAADRSLAGHLGIEVGARVQRITRLRSADGEPISLHSSHVPLDLAPTLLEADPEGDQLCVILERDHGLVMGHVHETLESTRASPTEGALLRINPGEPLLLLRQQVSTPQGRPFEYTRILFRGDRIRLEYSYDL